jgi:uncharacterized protein
LTIFLFLDANFLLIPAQINVDIYSEFNRLVPKPWEIVIISAVFSELEYKISSFSQKTKLKREYTLARQLLECHPFRLIESERVPNQLVDDLLLKTAFNYGNDENIVYICTNDKELRKKAKIMKLRTIFIRQQKYLETEEFDR